LDRKAIWQKALETGLATSQEMPDDDTLFAYIFQPGFSTARVVTDLSGRGVGMNVVQKMVDEFNGTIQVQSESGVGTTFIMSFPLTLAIISAVLVTISGEEFAFPLSDIVETIRIRRDEVTTLQGRDIINLRGEILPIFSTGPILGLFTESPSEEFPVMITSVGNRKVGFAVDSLTGKAEIVIKSLEQNYRSVRGLVGACLMGDGRIVLVLDVQGLVELVQKDSSRDPSLKALDYIAAMELETTAAVRAYNEGVQRITVRRLDDKKRTKAAETHESTATDTHAARIESHPVLETRAPVTSTAVPQERMESHLPHVPESKPPGKETSSAPPHTEPPVVPSVKLDILSEDEYARVHTVISAGMTSAGMVLSQLLGIKIDVAVPEFNALSFSDLPGYMPPGETICVGVGTEGQTHAHLFLVFDQSTGYQAAGDLLGLPSDHWNADHITKEDLAGVLCELGNIVGASILNSLANKAGHAITPTVPDFSQSRGPTVAADITALAARDQNLHLLYISADFFRQDMDLLARLFFLIPRNVLMSVAGRMP
ncbi:MAG: chemotaxis protein CheW, partial [Spirochaetia bacterium]|nr:chemotaxis protein CheW [Spirochaetia bacterium]